MGMTIDNLCKSCINLGCEFQSGIVRTECAFYMPPYIEPDNCGNYVVMKPIVEAIPKADYENRLKADMVAVLEEIDLQFNEICFCKRGKWKTVPEIKAEYSAVIREKINTLKGESEDEK